MKAKELLEIKKILNAAWRDVMKDEQSMAVWLDTFKNYDFGIVADAAREHIKTNKFRPTPADIIMLIPAKTAQNYTKVFVPKTERMPDGSTRRVISCRRCNDLGLITWEDENGCVVGRPCTCEAALANYGSKIIEEVYANG